MGKKNSGAANITHNLKVFGNGSMQKGLDKVSSEAYKKGQKDALYNFSSKIIDVVVSLFRLKRF